MSEEYVVISELGEIRDRLPEGDYNFKMLTLEAGQSKADKPMLTATYQVVDGENAGAEIKEWFSLAGRRSSKDNKMYYSGVSAIIKLMQSIGAPPPAGGRFPLDPQEARKVLGKAVQGKVLRGKVVPHTYEKDGEKKEGTRIHILGLKQAATVSASASADIDEDFS